MRRAIQGFALKTHELLKKLDQNFFGTADGKNFFVLWSGRGRGPVSSRQPTTERSTNIPKIYIFPFLGKFLGVQGDFLEKTPCKNPILSNFSIFNKLNQLLCQELCGVLGFGK